MKNSFDKWTRFYLDSSQKGVRHLYPAENLVRILKGSYVPNFDKDFREKRGIDVGCGSGNNIMLLASLGMQAYGTEISAEVCKDTKNELLSIGCEAEIRSGTNQNIPFETGFFDFLISWNVLHYEPNEESINRAIKEYARVLKRGGLIILSTAAPDHLIMNGTQVVGHHQYQISKEDDFRKGETFFYFDHPRYIKFYFDVFFENMHFGRVCEDLFGKVLDSFIFVAFRK